MRLRGSPPPVKMFTFRFFIISILSKFSLNYFTINVNSCYNNAMKRLEKVFNIKINDEELFKRALTHPSYTKEQEDSFLNSYERLEFLGDSVLKLLTSDILFEMFPEFPEGKLSKIRSIVVSDMTLAKIFKAFKLEEYLIIAKHEKKQGLSHNDTICACAFEALLGAFYLEGKLCELRTFLAEVLKPYIDDVNENYINFNAKALLQEYTQGINKQLPVYKLLEETGPAHKKVFTVQVSFNDEICGIGSGKTKKEAEQNAATEACKKFNVGEGQ